VEVNKFLPPPGDRAVPPPGKVGGLASSTGGGKYQ